MIREYYELKARHARLVVYLRLTFTAILVAVITVFTISIPYNLSHKPAVQTKATMAQKKANRVLAHQIAIAGWDWRGQQLKCLDLIFTKESRYDHLAKNKNSTAFGIAQHLGETSKVPAVQLTRAYKYIKSRYRTPCRAWSFHQRYNWY